MLDIGCACPVCGAAATILLRMAPAETRAELADAFGAQMPPEVPVAAYTMRECGGCGLVFADPMEPGGQPFYDWITGFDQYHARSRWEWGEARRLLTDEGRALSLMELGCGTGRFLERVADVPGLTAAGIDASAASVAAAQAKGLDVRCETLTDTLARGNGATCFC